MTIEIKSMGYVRVASTDLDQWTTFAGKVLGLAAGRGPHPDHHRPGVEDGGDRRDRRDHPADEAVHDLEGGDVDQNAAGAGLDDALGEVLLQREGDVVLQVDLDRDQQDVADAKDRDALHVNAPWRPDA